MFTPAHRYDLIGKVRHFPHYLEEAVRDLTPKDLTTAYLIGEWTVAQNVHHLADSHMNAYIRTKLILTEVYPTLKPYDQDVWATLPDADTAEIGPSILILSGLHRRWADLFDSLDEAQWQRKGLHPENGDMTIQDILISYANHCDAHLDQIARTVAARPTAEFVDGTTLQPR